MVAGCFTIERTSTVSMERLCKAVALDGHNLLPKVLPEYYVSGEIVENSGAGTIRKFKFTPAVKAASFIKDRVEVDQENHLVKYVIIDGGLIGKRLKSHVLEVKYEASDNGGCVVKTKIEYETLDDKPLSEEEVAKMNEGVVQSTKAVEGYLLANPTAYA
uniref:Pathogenesis-related protein 1 n=1 Tax=Elaeis guineensis var. tenera TaxID=51953 RepID=A0A6I9QSE1_ELAGV|nr:pathogenesis-related protein 1 [Elaeis guineensis]